MKYLQRLGKALMLPVSVMPICGLLMGIGYCLCPAAMQGGEIVGIVAKIGYFLIRAGGALIDHIAWLFAIGVVIGPAVQFAADALKQICSAEPPAEPLAAAGTEKLDSRRGKKEEIMPPAAGKRIPMEEIPDPVFSGGIMGPCFGIMPEDGRICAPVSGTVTAVAASGHAVSIMGSEGEILVHAGIDTVKLNGEGFKVYVREGEPVEQGQPVMEMDLNRIRERGFNPIIIVVQI